MRRALSLFALGSTLLAASALPLSFSSIKAFNTPAANKDSWSFKGTVATADGYLEDLLDYGITLELESDGTPLDEVVFDDDDCKSIRKETGVSCRTKGARFTVTEVCT
jgi:hypothetical protein